MGFWPYKSSLTEYGRVLFILLTGTIVGSKCVTYYYEPLKNYDKLLDEGKRDLLVKYRAKHEERLKRLGISKTLD
uniref:COX6C domain-containing protein n=1 Tax=Strongyloides papillosus TaxID=174720 RepID=A0A0N5BRV1_STREA